MILFEKQKRFSPITGEEVASHIVASGDQIICDYCGELLDADEDSEIKTNNGYPELLYEVNETGESEPR